MNSPQNSSNYSDWDYSELCELYYRQGWLIDGVNNIGFEKLWFDSSIEEREILKELILNFTYLREADAINLIRETLSKYLDLWNINSENTIFLALRPHQFADGSSMLLQTMKTALMEICDDWSEKQLISKFSDGLQYAKKGRFEQRKIKNVILVDDFVGTGVTAKNVVQELINGLGNNERNIGVYLFVLAGMSVGLKEVIKLNIPTVFCMELENGIEKAFPASEREKNRSMIRNMEQLLAEKIRTMELKNYSLGWGSCEGLFSWNGKNTPNNVLPIFWWSRYKDGSRRITMLHRMQ